MLTDSKIKSARPSDKPIQLSDGGGLYLEAKPNGSRLWRYRYSLNGARNMLSLGDYPRVSLVEARRRRDELTALVKDGINPVLHRKQERLTLQYEAAQTFKAVAEEWFRDKSPKWSEGYRHHVQTILDKDLNPRIGDLPIGTIRTPIVHDTIKRVEKRGAATRAILARQIVGSVFKLAILTHRAEFDPAAPLKGEIARRVVEHHRHLDRDQVGDFLRRVDDYSGHATTRIAISLLMFTAVRPGEICGASWAEFDLDKAIWRIPGPRMKTRRPHTVPLARQVVELLRELHYLTGAGPALFPNQGTKGGTVPPASLRNAVVKMGYGDTFSPHGARGTFSTIANELGYRPDVIEKQLAHEEQNRVRAAYNRAEYLEERRIMMQAYADLLDQLKAGAQVIPFRRKA
jgi:integrase